MQIVCRLDASSLDPRRADRSNGNRHALNRFRAALGGDDNLFDLIAASCRGIVVLRVGSTSGQEAGHGTSARNDDELRHFTLFHILLPVAAFLPRPSLTEVMERGEVNEWVL